MHWHVTIEELFSNAFAFAGLAGVVMAITNGREVP
jgi:hypothetical protein